MPVSENGYWQALSLFTVIKYDQILMRRITGYGDAEMQNFRWEIMLPGTKAGFLSHHTYPSQHISYKQHVVYHREKGLCAHNFLIFFPSPRRGLQAKPQTPRSPQWRSIQL